MPEAQFYATNAKPKGAYTLPSEFDGVVKEGALYHAVRAYRNNQRQGNASTKTRAEVSGGNRKPWRQKGTGRARQGSTRAPNWVGGGIAHGPRPRGYRTDLPRKVRRLARQSALNARAAEGAIHVIEGFTFSAPRTRQLVELLGALKLADKHVLLLTAEADTNLYLSGRNLQDVRVMRYRDAASYDILWAEVLVVEQAALGGTPGAAPDEAAPKRTRKTATPKKAAGRAQTKGGTAAAAKRTKTAAKAKPGTKSKRAAPKKKKDGGDA
ncbi:MAG: 50S ribosomal protein L4 [Gemmatimonadota bacterium]|nr:50S ribosomal protein L4 [Gemmatimonadota bacterium]MDH5195790.1 50S ribosomal protein L4 [Gemmatimonadota bacterium]